MITIITIYNLSCIINFTSLYLFVIFNKIKNKINKKPPMIPICMSKGDTRNFERYDEPLPDIIPPDMVDPYQELFKTF